MHGIVTLPTLFILLSSKLYVCWWTKLQCRLICAHCWHTFTSVYSAVKSVCYLYAAFLIQYLYALIPGRSMHLLVASWCCLGVIVPVQLASSWIRGCFFLSERCKRIGYSKGWLPCWLYSTSTLYVLSVGFQLVETTSTMQWCNLATTEHVKCFIGG